MADTGFRVGVGIGEDGQLKSPRSALTENQLFVAKLMGESLCRLRAEYWSLRTGILLAVLSLTIGAFLGGFAVTLVGWIAHRLNGPTWITFSVGLAPLLFTSFMIARWKWELYNRIEYETLGGVPHVRFARFDLVLGLSWMGYLLILGSVIGIQIQLLHLASDHCGLAIPGGWSQCVTIGLDNVCHGAFLEACMSSDVRLCPPISHSRTSTILFGIFRATSDTLVLILILALWHRRRVGHLAKGIERYAAEPNIKHLREYLRWACYESKKWGNTYHDEFLFFCLVEKYLRGNYGQCELLMGLFPESSFPREVRVRFTNRKGESLTAILNDEAAS